MAVTSPIRQRPRTTQRRELTWEEYLNLPLITKPYDIIDGVMIRSPAPISIHQYYSFQIAEPLRAHVRKNKLGVVLYAPVDVLIRKVPKLQTRQPDVLFLSAARTGIKGATDLLGRPVLDVVPDLVVEILSPDEDRSRLSGKLIDYASTGVSEAWIVSPEAKTVEILVLIDGTYQRSGLYGLGDVSQSTVLPDLHLKVDDIFAE